MVNQESESFISTNNECVVHEVSDKSADEQIKSTSEQNWKSFLSKRKRFQENPNRSCPNLIKQAFRMPSLILKMDISRWSVRDDLFEIDDQLENLTFEG